GDPRRAAQRRRLRFHLRWRRRRGRAHRQALLEVRIGHAPESADPAIVKTVPVPIAGDPLGVHARRRTLRAQPRVVLLVREPVPAAAVLVVRGAVLPALPLLIVGFALAAIEI